jgi:4-diphosphocytidyl-2-C-methyl-D-erythritol kinase
MREHAPAKLNLALHVRARREGYHELETLFAFTEFGDTLEAGPAGTLTLHVTGSFADAAGPLADNLVLRAARALAPERAAELRLVKRIPAAAGLGGGSADAAATLRLLNRLWGLGRTLAELEAIAATLGADVPACVASTAQLGTGRGEILTTIDASTLAGAPVLLVNPRVAVPTGPVFAAWDGIDRGPLNPTEALTGGGRNDLEAPAIGIAPVIADVLGWLRARPGVRWARMSGSGATCFALFESDEACAAAAAACPAGWWAEATRLR